MNIPITWMTFHAYGEEEDNRGKIMDDYVIDGDLAFSDMRSALKFYQEQYHKKKEWVKLTEDEICDCIDKTSSLDKGQFLVEFAMSIEDKLKEKNS